MTAIRVRLRGEIEQQQRRFKRRLGSQGRPTAAVKVAVVTALVAAALYTVNQPGQVEFTSPPNPWHIDAAEVTVSGSVGNSAVGKLGLMVGDQRHRVDVIDGRFSATLPIQPGTNTIRPVAATLGLSIDNHSDSLIVHSVKHPGPVRIVTPGSGATVFQSEVTVAGTVSLSAEVRQPRLRHITLEVNHHPHRVELVDGRFTQSVNLQPGVNTIRALGGAWLASESKSQTITLAEPGEISITAPSDRTYIDARSTDIRGTVANRDVDSVQLLINGQREVTEVKEGKFSLEAISLQPGVNVLQGVVGNTRSSPVHVIAPTLWHDFNRDLVDDFNQGQQAWSVGQGEGTMVREERIGADHQPGCLTFRDAALRPLELVFAIDVSDSMQPWIDQMKGQTEEIIKALLSDVSDVRIGFVPFGSAEQVAAHEFVPYAGDDMALKAKLGEFKATGGVDPGEELYLALLQAFKMAWRSGAVAKVIVVITDDIASPGDKTIIRPSVWNRLRQLATQGLDGVSPFNIPGEFNSATLVEQKAAQDWAANALNAVFMRKLAAQQNITILAIIVGGEEAPLQDAKNLVRAEDVVSSTEDALVDRIVVKTFNARERFGLGTWRAPAVVVEKLKTARGGVLVFDRLANASAEEEQTWITADDVTLVAAEDEHSLVYRIPEPPLPPRLWHRYELRLSGDARWPDDVRLPGDAGWIKLSTGEQATDADIAKTLSTLTEVRIRADFHAGADTSALDNVMIFPALDSIPEPIRPEDAE